MPETQWGPFDEPAENATSCETPRLADQRRGAARANSSTPTRPAGGPPLHREAVEASTTGSWVVSSYELLSGTDVTEGPDTVPADLFDELFAPAAVPIGRQARHLKIARRPRLVINSLQADLPCRVC